jgi:hypothetical protein
VRRRQNLAIAIGVISVLAVGGCHNQPVPGVTPAPTVVPNQPIPGVTPGPVSRPPVPRVPTGPANQTPYQPVPGVTPAPTVVPNQPIPGVTPAPSSPPAPSTHTVTPTPGALVAAPVEARISQSSGRRAL